MDTRALVVKMVTANPRVSAAEIAREAKVSRTRVCQLLDALGYYLFQEWRKARKGKT